MEIIVALVVIALVGYWLYTSNQKDAVAAPVEETKVDTVNAVPYKVEAPAPAVEVAPAKAKKPAAKKPAATKAKAAAPKAKPAAKPAAKKPAVKKAPAKKKPSA